MFKKKRFLLLLVVLLTSLSLIGCGAFDDDNGEEELETDIEDAKTFVSDTRGHGVDLTDAGMFEAQSVEAHFENEVIPNMNAVGSRLAHATEILDFWAEGYYEEVDGEEIPVIAHPGEYTLELEEFEEEEYYIAKQQEAYSSETDKWEWVFNFPDNDRKVEIKITNFNKIIERDDEGEIVKVDLTKAKFDFDYSDDKNQNFEWSLSSALETSEHEEMIIPGEDDSDIEIYLPRIATWETTGTMVDDLDDEGEIEKITFSANHSLDLENEKKLSFAGEFIADEFSYDGAATVEFESFPAYEDIMKKGEYPLLAKISANGGFSTDKLSLAGGYEIDFANLDYEIEDDEVTISLPERIAFDGLYESSFEQAFAFDGSISLETDYANVDLADLYEYGEKEDNYLAFDANMDMSLDSADFSEVALDVKLSRVGYDAFTSNFTYDYENTKYITGTVIIEEESFDLRVENELGLRILIDEEDEERDDGVVIGEITDADYEHYGYIIDSGEDIYVEFKDGTIESLLPEGDK